MKWLLSLQNLMLHLIILNNLSLRQTLLLLKKKIKQADFLNGHMICCSLAYLFNIAGFPNKGSTTKYQTLVHLGDSTEHKHGKYVNLWIVPYVSPCPLPNKYITLCINKYLCITVGNSNGRGRKTIPVILIWYLGYCLQPFCGK